MTASTDQQQQTDADQIGADAADHDTQTNSDTETGSTADAGTDSGADALGEAGKKALDRMKTERNEAKAALAEYKKLGLDPARLAELIGKSETDAAEAEKTRVQREADATALTKANERLVKAELKAAATGKLADPKLVAQDLAAIGVDVASFDVDDDGNVDSEAIKTAIDELLTKRPYLAAQGDPKRFQGSGDNGHRGTAGKPQWTQQDLDRASMPEVEAARKEGLLNDVLGIKSGT